MSGVEAGDWVADARFDWEEEVFPISLSIAHRQGGADNVVGDEGTRTS